MVLLNVQLFNGTTGDEKSMSVAEAVENSNKTQDFRAPPILELD